MTDTFAAVREIDRTLLAPGGMFEQVEAEVLGERMQVFKERTRTVRELLEKSSAHGDKDFLVFDGGPRITFVEHAALVAQLAASFQRDHGIGKGDRVAICGANAVGWVLAAHATLSLGAIVVALNSWWSPTELRSALELTEPSLIVADARRREHLQPFDAAVQSIEMERVLDQATASSADVELPDLDEDDPAVLMFTSGTSGKPKAAVLSHRAVVGFVQLNLFIGTRTYLLSQTADQSPGGPTEIARLSVFPLFHVSGLGSLFAALQLGHKTVWPAGRFDPERVIELTRAERINIWSGASTHLVRLLDSPTLDSFDPLQLRQAGIGGSASTPSLIARTEARFPHLKGTFSSGYGLTESGGLISYATNAMLQHAADCVGFPLPTMEVRIVGEDNEDLPDGEIGTVVVRSPILMTEYFRNPDANAAAFLPGRWLRTEDFGRLEDGVLYIASRRRDLIIRGGENVYPIEVEDCLDRHPDVIESAVFGREHEDLGHDVHAIAVVRDGASVTAAELTSWCAGALAYFKVPSTLEVRTRPLPRNASGKILKHLLESGTEDIASEDPG